MPFGGDVKKNRPGTVFTPFFVVVVGMFVIVEHIFIGFMAIVPFETGIC